MHVLYEQFDKRKKRTPWGGTVADHLPLIRPRSFPCLAVAKMSNISHEICAPVPPAACLPAVSHFRGICSKLKLRTCAPVEAVALSSHGASHGRSSFTKHPVHRGLVGSEQCGGGGSAPAGVVPITVPPRLKRTTATVKFGSGLAHSSWACGLLAMRPPAKPAAVEYSWSTSIMTGLVSSSMSRCCMRPSRGSLPRISGEDVTANNASTDFDSSHVSVPCPATPSSRHCAQAGHRVMQARNGGRSGKASKAAGMHSRQETTRLQAWRYGPDSPYLLGQIIVYTKFFQMKTSS